MTGILDWLRSPEEKIAEQRAAVSADLAYQRAQAAADMRAVGTELVIKASIAALLVVGVGIGASYLARRRHA